MKPFYVLITVFLLALTGIFLFKGIAEYGVAGRIAMSVMLLFTAVGHFPFPKGMRLMVPDFIPFKTAIVYITGILEFVLAITLLIPSLQILTAWTLIIFFIVLVPANIKAAMEHLDYEKGTYDGKGLSYLWLRIPLQILFITWVYVFAVNC
jgi:uncharacterized membrane protein